jgi:hypothetical protein
LAGWCKVENVRMSGLGPEIPDLDARIADDDVVADDRVSGARGDEQPVGVSRNVVFFNDVVVPTVDDANAEIVGWLSVPVPVRLI